MTAPIVIRTARAADDADVNALFEELDRLHREGAPWLLRKPDGNPRPPKHLEAIRNGPDSALFVADRGRCVALAHVRLVDAPSFPVFIPQQHAVIEDFIVDRGWRRRGVGRLLYAACEDWSHERGASWLELNVYEFNTEASDFYSAVGFETTMRKMRKPLR